MQTIIKKTILIAMLFATCKVMHAQNFQAQYEYDANGNRTKVTIVYLSSKSANRDFKGVVKDSMANYHINVFPNPTKGNLLIQISGASDEQLSSSNSAIKIWNIQGQQLISISPISTDNIVDLSKYPGGTYVLKVTIAGQVKDYKIVKD